VSADNGVWVAPIDGSWWVLYGFASGKFTRAHFMKEGTRYPSREAALVAAHQLAKEYSTLEYGVNEIEPADWDRKGIKLTCESGHVQTIWTPDHEHASAARLAGILDGTSSMYAISPRDPKHPSDKIGRCEWPVEGRPCKAWITATLLGYS
jgi:hypothetical protein